jgi:tRNA A37 threonylcarbamoyladenosine modification protein TsaB
MLIKNKLVQIILEEKGKNIDRLSFPEENNLSEKLLPCLDELLKKNKLEPKDVKKVIADVETPESFTTSRIAKAVAESFNWAISATNKV